MAGLRGDRATGRSGITGAAHIAVVMHDFSGGGSERVAIRLANAWAGRGRRVTILCGSEDGPARALVAPGVTVSGLRPRLERGFLSRLRLGRAMAPHIRRIDPDLIFGPGNFHLPVLHRLAAALGADRPPIACKLSNPLAHAGRGPVAQRLFGLRLRTTARPVDLPVAMSERLRDEARRLLRRNDIACIAEPTLDDDHRPPPPAHAETGPILCIGRLVPQKRFDLALRAFALLPPEGGTTLVIVGDGPARARLHAEARRLGIADRVSLPGHVADVAPHLARARLLLCSSLYEGYPAVLVEALAAGVPVVTTACSPAIGEIMAHPSCGTIAPDDPSALAGAIVAQMGRPRPDAAAIAALAARHRIGPVADAYLTAFDRAVAARRGG